MSATSGVEDKREIEEVLEFVHKDAERLVFRTDHRGCNTEAIWRHDRVTTWVRMEGYDGWVIDGTCPGCRRLYRMRLPNHLMLEALLR